MEKSEVDKIMDLYPEFKLNPKYNEEIAKMMQKYHNDNVLNLISFIDWVKINYYDLWLDFQYKYLKDNLPINYTNNV